MIGRSKVNERSHDITSNEMLLDVGLSPKKKNAKKNLILIKLSFFKDHFRKCVQWRCLDLSVACNVSEYSVASKTIILVLII